MKNKQYTTNELIDIATKLFNVTRSQLTSGSRKGNLARIRQIIWYLGIDVYKNTTYKECAYAFGGRDHSTAHYGVANVREMVINIKTNPVLYSDYQRFLDKLNYVPTIELTAQQFWKLSCRCLFGLVTPDEPPTVEELKQMLNDIESDTPYLESF